MDNQQPVFPKDFFKQFKNKDEFQSFFNQLFKRGVEEMLRGELDEHLGYEKHRPPRRKDRQQPQRELQEDRKAREPR
jgi:transposase-like protein